ncbi:hypothetical protein CS542_04530 [Pedobacter sp. IW39]|nr:hypothetical protein CS542_04530 [Pedobacter sp. IW39]
MKRIPVCLFGMMRLSLGDKNRIPIHQEIHKWYGENYSCSMTAKEENLDKRIAVYRAFYKEWYNFGKHIN